MFLLAAFFVIIFISTLVWLFNDSYEKGKKKGSEEVWKKVGNHIMYQTPLSLSFRNTTGVKLTKEYLIKEKLNEVDIRGSFSISNPREGTVYITVAKDLRVIANLELSSSKIPKSLWGQNIEGTLTLY